MADVDDRPEVSGSPGDSTDEAPSAAGAAGAGGAGAGAAVAEEEVEVLHGYLEERAIPESEKLPLVRAARTRDLDTLEYLLAGPDPQRGMTALHHAAALGDEEAVLMLLDSGDADLELRDRCGSTPLHHAALYNHPKVVKLLLQSGSDINAQKENGRTSLHEAAWIGHMRVLEVLIEARADPHILEANHRKAAQIARLNHADKAAERVEAYVKFLADEEYRAELARRNTEWQRAFAKATSRRRDCGATSPRKKRLTPAERKELEDKRAARDARRAERRRRAEERARVEAERVAAREAAEAALALPSRPSSVGTSVCSYSMSDSELSARGLQRGTFICKCPYCSGWRKTQETDEWEAAKQAQYG